MQVNLKMYFCHQCNKEFVSKYTLNRHVQRLHNPEASENDSDDNDAESDISDKGERVKGDIFSDNTDAESDISNKSTAESQESYASSESSDNDDDKRFSFNDIQSILRYYKTTLKNKERESENE